MKQISANNGWERGNDSRGRVGGEETTEKFVKISYLGDAASEGNELSAEPEGGKTGGGKKKLAADSVALETFSNK